MEISQFAIHCADAATASAVARIRLWNISPSSTQTTGPQLMPNATTYRFAATRATLPVRAAKRAGRRREPVAVAEAAHAIVPSVTTMPAEPMSSSGLRPTLSTSAIATSVVSDVGDASDHGDQQRVGLAEADRVPQRRRVVEDHVDADELLEHREQDADPDDRQQPEPRAAQVAQVHVSSPVPSDRWISAIRLSTSPPTNRSSTSRALASRLLADQVARRLGDLQRHEP